MTMNCQKRPVFAENQAKDDKASLAQFEEARIADCG